MRINKTEKASIPVEVEKEIVTELEQIFRIVDDKPYFELKYKKVGEDYYHVGYSSFDFHNVLKWKEDCFELVKEEIVDEREAIERLTDHFRIHYDGRPTPYLDKAVAIAMNALHKQIPKKPKNIKTILDFSGRYYTTKGDCPVCNREGLYKSDFYCNRCGQKLDWSEEK